MQRDLFLSAEKVVVIPGRARIDVCCSFDLRPEFRYSEDSDHGACMDAPWFVSRGGQWNFDYEGKGEEFIVCAHVSREWCA